MARLMPVVEKRPRIYFDTALIETGQEVRLFGNERIGDRGKTNLQVGSQAPGELEFRGYEILVEWDPGAVEIARRVLLELRIGEAFMINWWAGSPSFPLVPGIDRQTESLLAFRFRIPPRQGYAVVAHNYGKLPCILRVSLRGEERGWGTM